MAMDTGEKYKKYESGNKKRTDTLKTHNINSFSI